MIEDMTIRNLSPATQRSYVHAVKKFSEYFGTPPDRPTLEDVRACQVHLISRGIAWATLNRIVCALRFFVPEGAGGETATQAVLDGKPVAEVLAGEAA